MNLQETIAAIATPTGIGALGIVRISGPHALEIAARVFSSPHKKNIANLAGYQAAYGFIKNPETGHVVDEVVILIMRKPHSYTGEDMVEITGHGGPVPLKSILEAVLDGGARLAEPGEFTLRAFLHGRMDLAQAEAVQDVIMAKTQKSLNLALQQLEGSVSRFIRESHQKLMEVLAYVEASIDFPEDELDGFSLEEGKEVLQQVQEELSQAVAASQRGRVYREGVRVTIVGRPNVGKSTLLNALLGEDRALVTEVPGTTRDSVEEIINLKGIPLRLIDTAGLRETEDQVEILGVTRTRELLKRSDLVLVVLDVTEGITQEDEAILQTIPPERSMVVVNKIDLRKEIDTGPLLDRFSPDSIKFISALEGQGLEEVLAAIGDKVVGEGPAGEGVMITNLRHERALDGALQAVKRSLQGWQEGVPVDLLAVDIREAISSLGQITGETVGTDITREIFSRYCIGK